jgi:hypothetical protein
MHAPLSRWERSSSISQSNRNYCRTWEHTRTKSPKYADGKKSDHPPIKFPKNHGSPCTNDITEDRLYRRVSSLYHCIEHQMMKERIRTFNLVIMAMTPTTMFILCGDQPTAIEGMIILMMIGMPWVVIPEPTKSTMVASMKMIVVIANTKICPGEFNKDPLELQKSVSERRNV